MVGGILSTTVVGCGLVDLERFLRTFTPGFLSELLGIPVMTRKVRFGSAFDLQKIATSSFSSFCCSATATSGGSRGSLFGLHEPPSRLRPHPGCA